MDPLQNDGRDLNIQRPAGGRYVVISPCRNEAPFLNIALSSVLRQSVLPSHWIIVNDGSTDGTTEILEAFARSLPWVQIVLRANRGSRSVGPGVVDAFYDGLCAVGSAEYEFLCKLDLDLQLPAKYFETLINRMQENPRIGSCSGRPYICNRQGNLVPEPCTCSFEMSVGASKFYRRTCFEQVGGLVREVMWDGIDCHRSRMLGWIARSWDDVEDLRFQHLRPTGSSEGNILAGRMRHGFGQYFMGTGMAFITASALSRVTKYPPLVGSAAMWWGYVSSLLRRRSRYSDPHFIRFLRRYQRLCLVVGKKRAVKIIEDNCAAYWDPTREPTSGGKRDVPCDTSADDSPRRTFAELNK